MNLELQNKVAIVSGGASGIGRAISEGFAAEGARVVLTWFESEQGANEVVSAIEGAGGEALAIQADLGTPGVAEQVVQTTLERFGQLDAVVANAGGLLRRAPIETCDFDLWQQAVHTNLTSCFLTCQAAIPALKQSKGSIVTISSLAAHDGGGAGSGHYSTTKGGVLTFTKALAKELGPAAVRVNSVAPGLIGTQFHDEFSTPEGRAATVARTPIAREGTPQDVADVVVFLASPRASFLTGECVEVNGGQGLY